MNLRMQFWVYISWGETKVISLLQATMQAITTSLLVVCAALAAQAGLLPALPSISDLWPAHSDKVPDLGNPRWGNAPDNDIIEPFKIEYSEEVSIY